MPASDFEFRHRTWFIFGIFCLGLACYALDSRNSGVVVARVLHSHVAVLKARNLRSNIRGVFLIGALIVTLGGLIRAWGAAYLRAEVVQDSKVRTERLVADGPFRYTRNPLYLGLMIGVFGAGLLCSRTGWVVQMILVFVFCYRLIRREEAELYLVQGDRLVAYYRAVRRLLPALRARVSASGALPHWHEAFAAQTPWWAIAAGEVAYAFSLRLSIALLVALAGVPVHLAQKRASSFRRAALRSISVQEFISEDDLKTFEGWLRYQGVDATTASPEDLQTWRGMFEEVRAATDAAPKVGLMKLRTLPGEYRYAVALRDGSELWIALWVRRSPKGEFFVFLPRADPSQDVHVSYHLDGTLHIKSYGQKTLSRKLQPPTGNFRGTENLSVFAGYGPKGVGAICDPAAFAGVVEVGLGILGPKDGVVSIDLVEPGCKPMKFYGRIFKQETFTQTVPSIVVTVGSASAT